MLSMSGHPYRVILWCHYVHILDYPFWGKKIYAFNDVSALDQRVQSDPPDEVNLVAVWRPELIPGTFQVLAANLPLYLICFFLSILRVNE